MDDGAGDRTPYPFALVLEQDKTERLLIRALEEAGGAVEWGTELTGLTQDSDGVRTVVRHPDSSEETVEVGWVVGADGASSPVRHGLGLGFAGETYEQTLFLADVEMEWGLGSQQACIDLTREGFYGFFPMPGGRFRVIGSVPPELEGKEEISADDVQGALDRHSGMWTRITDVRWTSVYRTHRRMTERFRAGRVFLVGDAAHIHSPAGGQGMNTGIGDAYNLAWKLALVARNRAHETLLDSYEAERMPFARSILNGTDRGFSLQVTTDGVAQRLKPVVSPLLFGIASSLPPLRRRVFWLISQLWTNYRHSPAVARAGRARRGPRPGERAPYGRFEGGPEAGTGLFRSLKGVDHHLLFFEGLRPDPDRDAAEPNLQRLLDRYEAPVRLHRIPARNRELHRRYGAGGPTLILVRPDGHIAYRGDGARLEDLAAYLNRWFGKAEAARAPQPAPSLGARTGGGMNP